MFAIPEFSGAPARAALSLTLALFAGAALAAAPAPLHHELTVALDPAASRIDATDTLHLPADHRGALRLRLGAAFALHAEGARLERLDGDAGGRFREYSLIPDDKDTPIRLRYAGRIEGGAHSGEHGMPLAVLDTEGAYLDGASGWVPWAEDMPATFNLTVEAPAGWRVVSQGTREADRRRWRIDTPQEDLYLVAGRFTRSAREHGAITLETYLLEDDAALAGRYLAVMGQYLDFYGALIAPYPYPRFAVVENRWQTGYGMPSFTLLGSRVLRLPFILHSSLPHEILHNWWGNGVWVDAREGNWSEGLTAYLADHLIAEAQGRGAEYRRRLLERYTAFAAEGRDIALREFTHRHSDATQAVGYGKTLMLFHMLRRELGDEAFVAGLRRLWQRHRFGPAAFGQVGAAFAAGKALDAVWLERPGAPELEIAALAVDGHGLSLALRQRQAGPAYPLRVPVVVQTEAGSERLEAVFDGREARVSHTFAQAVLRVDVDPHFDVFRRLDALEQPPSLARLFGARTQWLVLPQDAPAAERAAWQRFAEAWSQRFDNVRVTSDAEPLPQDGAVWLLGWRNRALPAARARLTNGTQMLEADGARLAGATFPAADAALVLLDPDNRRAPLGFIGAPDAAAVAGLARKLPHYGSYGRLAFAAGSLDKRLAEALPVAHSPLQRVIGERDPGPPTEGGSRLVDAVNVPLRFD